MRLLLVEDDTDLAAAVREALRRRGVEADVAHDAGDALQMIENARYAAVLLDLGLPDIDGVTLIERLRARRNPIPILALTARSALADRIRGLNAGADDYIVKPFEPDELVARVQAVLRRQSNVAETIQAIANVRFNHANGDLWVDAEPVLLSARERQLTELLVRRVGSVVPKRLAEDQLFGLDEPTGSNALEVYVHRLRRKLADAGAAVRIETIRGVGYLLKAA